MWSAEPMPELPVHEIDLAPFRTGRAADRAEVAAAFDRAGRGSGFILLTGHGVDPALVDDAFAAWQAFFDLPLEEKLRSVAAPESEELFLDGDPSTIIDTIPSCVEPGDVPRYPTVQAGEWLMAKIVGGQKAQPVDLHEGGLTGATNR